MLPGSGAGGSGAGGASGDVGGVGSGDAGGVGSGDAFGASGGDAGGHGAASDEVLGEVLVWTRLGANGALQGREHSHGSESQMTAAVTMLPLPQPAPKMRQLTVRRRRSGRLASIFPDELVGDHRASISTAVGKGAKAPCMA